MSGESNDTRADLSLTDVEVARGWLRQIAFIRAFESSALALSLADPPRVKGSIHLCAGQEAVPVAAAAALAAEDKIVATYRGHGWALAAGLDPEGVMAEICHRASGINGGRAGSAYLMAPWTRFVGENSIVGAGTTIACGVALAQELRGRGGVVVVSVGDGAMNQGSVHEAMAFAAVRALPLIFVVENNGWSELTATVDMYRIPRLAQRAAGYGIPAVTAPGHDPFAVFGAISGAVSRAREGGGPGVLEFLVPRLWGHYNRDMEHYRSAADRTAAEALDPITHLSRRLIEAGAETEQTTKDLVAAEALAVEKLTARALSAPEPDPEHSPAIVATASELDDPAPTEVRQCRYIDAVNLALRAELASDPGTIVFGEDVGKSGGIFQASKQLQRDFGPQRVFDMPIAENAILGSAVGAAMSGLRPIAEIMWADFLFVAIDQLINQAANVRFITGGRASVPLVVRTQQGATPGSCAQHSQSIEALLTHIPGIKVAMPSCPADAYSLLRAAAADPDPCVVIESRSLYQVVGPVALTAQAEPAGRAKLRRSGEDALIVTWGPMVTPSIDAARALEDEDLDVGVLDLRWLAPLDERALFDAARSAKGRVLVVHEAVRTGGFAGELITRLMEGWDGSAPLRAARLTTPDVRMPASPALQAALLPNARKIADAVRDLVRVRATA